MPGIEWISQCLSYAKDNLKYTRHTQFHKLDSND